MMKIVNDCPTDEISWLFFNGNNAFKVFFVRRVCIFLLFS